MPRSDGSALHGVNPNQQKKKTNKKTKKTHAFNFFLNLFISLIEEKNIQ